MAGVLEVVAGNTKPTLIQFQDSGVPKNVTDWVVTARVGAPASTTLNGTVVDAANGEVTIPFSSVAAGSYEVEITTVDENEESQTSEKFNLLVRNPL